MSAQAASGWRPPERRYEFFTLRRIHRPTLVRESSLYGQASAPKGIRELLSFTDADLRPEYHQPVKPCVSVR